MGRRAHVDHTLVQGVRHLTYIDTRGRAHFKQCRGNSILNDRTQFHDFAVTATPDVGSVDGVSTAAFGSVVTTTNFLNGMDGQELNIRMSVNTTIAANANIKPRGGVNVSGGNANDFMRFMKKLGVWVEEARSF